MVATLQSGIELAHVAWPGVLDQGFPNVRAKRLPSLVPSVKLVQSEFDERRNVLRSGSQRREGDPESCEAEEEVAPQRPLFEHLIDVSIGGGYQSRIGMTLLFGSHRTVALLFDRIEQFALDLSRQLTNLV